MEDASILRRRTMQAVKSKNTKPELLVRRIVFAAGYRYRLHKQGLPGKPDLVFVQRKKTIFVHGCFWHGHNCARGSRIPKANQDYWIAKIARNRKRDYIVQKQLINLGWSSLIIWECELKETESLLVRILKFLN